MSCHQQAFLHGLKPQETTLGLTLQHTVGANKNSGTGTTFKLAKSQSILYQCVKKKSDS